MLTSVKLKFGRHCDCSQVVWKWKALVGHNRPFVTVDARSYGEEILVLLNTLTSRHGKGPPGSPQDDMYDGSLNKFSHSIRGLIFIW